MYKLKINSLNGWQRLFVLFSLIIYLVAFLSVNEPEIVKSELPVGEYLPNKFVAKGENCDSNGKCNYKFSDLWDEIPIGKNFTVKDKTVVLADESATQDQVETAYIKALNFAIEKRQLILQEKYKSVFGLVTVTLMLVYVFGWMVGWVINGFKKNNDK
jgi:hypothetical protein